MEGERNESSAFACRDPDQRLCAGGIQLYRAVERRITVTADSARGCGQEWKVAVA